MKPQKQPVFRSFKNLPALPFAMTLLKFLENFQIFKSLHVVVSIKSQSSSSGIILSKHNLRDFISRKTIFLIKTTSVCPGPQPFNPNPKDSLLTVALSYSTLQSMRYPM